MYYFCMKPSILRDFQICIYVPLNMQITHIYVAFGYTILERTYKVN